MPVERRNPTPDLIQALREYHAVSGQRVTLAWTMMSGVNVGEGDAQRLAELTSGLPIKLDLIDVNDPSGRFRDALRVKLGMPVARRYSGGLDIHAACGMLAGGSAQKPICGCGVTLDGEESVEQKGQWL
jgi:23S rRNA (adenine2503-C2)-methyltransferase